MRQQPRRPPSRRFRISWLLGLIIGCSVGLTIAALRNESRPSSTQIVQLSDEQLPAGDEPAVGSSEVAEAAGNKEVGSTSSIPLTDVGTIPTPALAAAARTPAPDRRDGIAAIAPVMLPPVSFTYDPELDARVSAVLAGVSGRIGIAIKDLHTGRGVLHDADGEYEAASLFKVPVMYEVYRQREQGRLSFAESLVLTDRHVAFDLGTLDREAGDSIVLAEALERMITISDNSSAVLLTDRVGALNIERTMQTLGLRHTRIRLNDLTTSPGDMLILLESLARGDTLNSAASAEMVRLLSRQRVNDRIPRLLPPGTIVAHKTGNLAGVVHDVGIIYGPDATLIVVVLVNRSSNERQATQVIADLALLAYEYFSRLPGP